MSEDIQLAQDVALDARSFLETLEAVASGEAGSQAISLLLLDVARICVSGAQLGALNDVILESNVEPVVPSMPDVDGLRVRLAEELKPVDEYLEVFDPYGEEELVAYSLSDDLTEIAGDLLHGLRHFDAGRGEESLWWWQFTYLNHWGNHAGAALRALQAVVAHVRLDAVPDR
ncbi:MAG: DUF5063 domain-containing protein [Actinobacteria bacterium]|nr:DUF5063 domain-containing protein [Actinomycetota bacterium]MCA1720883.1 DUF5063 domain-containing protein [Actinomycetota bacterium]